MNWIPRLIPEKNGTPGLVLVCFSKLNKIQVWVPIPALQIRPHYGFGNWVLVPVPNLVSGPIKNLVPVLE